MAAGDAPMAPGDPYATSKANLRDTIKWLAGIFGALAAAVIAGVPISGLGATKETPAFLPAAVALLLAFAAICFALVLTLRLLRSDLLYASDVDPSKPISGDAHGNEIEQIRADIEKRATDLLPAGYTDMGSFLRDIDGAVEKANDIKKEVIRLDALNPRDTALIDDMVAQYGRQQGVVHDFRVAQQRVMAYASYLRFYNRLRRATKWLLLLGTIALLTLAWFGVETRPPKEIKAPTVVVIPIGGPSSSNEIGERKPVLLDPVYFATGSAVVTAEGKQAIQRARDLVRGHLGAALLVMARTDTVGASKVNASLARERGQAVRRLLIERGGVGPTQVFIAELPKNDLPVISGEREDFLRNRTVSLHMIEFDRSAASSALASTTPTFR